MADNDKPLQFQGRTWAPKKITTQDLSVDRSGSLASLAKKYGVSARDIVAANEVQFNTAAINEWVTDAGGKMLSSGFAVFEPGNRIFLPTTAPTPGPQAAQVESSGMPWWAWAGVGVAGFIALTLGRKGDDE